MKIADIRDKALFMSLLRPYEQIRATWVRETPCPESYLDDLATKFLNGGHVILDSNGFVIISERLNDKGLVKHVYVAEDSRRRGTGRVLIEIAESELARRGCETIDLAVSHYNREALGFFVKVGYTKSGESRDYYHLSKNMS